MTSVEVQTRSGPAAAPIPPSALAPTLCPLMVFMTSTVVSVYGSGMSSAAPTQSRIELPRISTGRFTGSHCSRRPTPNTARPVVRQRVRPNVSEVPPTMIKCELQQGEMVIATGTPWTAVPSVGADGLIMTVMLEPA